MTVRFVQGFFIKSRSVFAFETRLTPHTHRNEESCGELTMQKSTSGPDRSLNTAPRSDEVVIQSSYHQIRQETSQGSRWLKTQCIETGGLSVIAHGLDSGLCLPPGFESRSISPTLRRSPRNSLNTVSCHMRSVYAGQTTTSSTSQHAMILAMTHQGQLSFLCLKRIRCF